MRVDAAMTNAHWTGAMSPPSRGGGRPTSHVVHRTVIPIVAGSTLDVMRNAHAPMASADRVTYLPPQHIRSSLPSLFRLYERSAPGDDVRVRKPATSCSADRSGFGQLSSGRPGGFPADSRDPDIGDVARHLGDTVIGERDAVSYDRRLPDHGTDSLRSRTDPHRTLAHGRPNSGATSKRGRSDGTPLDVRCQNSDAIQNRRAQALPISINPILKRQGEGRSPRTLEKTRRRRACFKQEVDICYFDSSDRPQTTVSMATRSKGVACGAYIVDPAEGATAAPTCPAAGGQIPTPVIPPNGPEPCLAGDVDPERGIACTTDVRIIPCVDGRGRKGRLLRMNVRAGVGCVRERTLVRALSGGGAVIVHLFQNEAGSPVLRRHVKKLALPVNVDPYRVRAHVHRDGLLTIEAPVVDCTLPKI